MLLLHFRHGFVVVSSKKLADRVLSDYDNSLNISLEIPAKKKTRKTSKFKINQRFHWNNEMVQGRLNSLNDLQSSYPFKGLDFESE